MNQPAPRDLTYDINPTPRLLQAERDALWEVYRRHFDADRGELEASLARADRVIRFRERDGGRVRGMVVTSLRETTHAGRTFHWLWAGALAIDRECRGKWLLERAGLEVMARFKLRRPFAPLYWIYESLSFQSYRMMARNLEVYWPHPSRPTPAWEEGVIDALARSTYGERWDPGRRVLRPTGRKTIRPDSSRTTAADADTLRAFYRAMNPDAQRGASVVLLAPLDGRNARSVAGRLVRGARTAPDGS